MLFEHGSACLQSQHSGDRQDGSLSVRPLCTEWAPGQEKPCLEKWVFMVTIGIFPVPVLPQALTPRGFCFWGPPKSVLAVRSWDPPVSLQLALPQRHGSVEQCFAEPGAYSTALCFVVLSTDPSTSHRLGKRRASLLVCKGRPWSLPSSNSSILNPEQPTILIPGFHHCWAHITSVATVTPPTFARPTHVFWIPERCEAHQFVSFLFLLEPSFWFLCVTFQSLQSSTEI